MVELKTDSRAAGRGAIALLASQSLSRLLLIAFLIVAARKVGPFEFSRYATVSALLVVTGFIGDFGTTATTTKLVSAGEDSDKVLRKSLSACALLGLLGYAVGLALAGAIGHSVSAVIDFAVGAFSLPMDAIGLPLSGALDGRGLISQRSLVTLVRIGGGSILGIIAIETTLSIRASLIGIAMGPALAMVVAAFLARRYRVWSWRLSLDPRGGLELIRKAIPLAAVTGAAAALARADVLALSAISPGTPTADYNLALRAAEAFQYPLWAMIGPTLYIFSKRLADMDFEGAIRAFQVAMKAFFAISLPIAAGTVVLSRQVIDIAFGQAYRGAITPLVILGAGLWLTYIIGLGSMFLTSFPNMKPVVKMVVILDVASIAMQMPFIIAWRADGAALGLMLVNAVTLVVQLVFVKRTIGAWLPVVPPWRLVIAAAACAAVAWALRDTSLTLAVASGAACYFALAILGGGITREETRSFFSLVRR